MCERFLKLNIDEDRDHPGDWLALKYPNAFILLYFIARRARRYNGHPDGLIIGDALIGSSDFEPKMSRQNFRTAIEKLVELKYISLVSNGKKLLVDRKSTINVTITGMLVNLCDTRIWDINSDDGNQRSNQRPTNDQPTANHKQRKNKKEKKEEEYKEDARTDSQPRTKDALIFNFDSWSFEGILEKDTADWKIMYPHIDLTVETLKAAQWLKNNPSKSRKKNWRKYLTGWFQRGNDSAENKKAYKAAMGATGADRRTKDIEGNPVDNQHKGKF